MSALVHPPAFLPEMAKRDWWQLYLEHSGCEPDSPDAIPHWCAVRALLMDSAVVRFWCWLARNAERLEGQG